MVLNTNFLDHIVPLSVAARFGMFQINMCIISIYHGAKCQKDI